MSTRYVWGKYNVNSQQVACLGRRGASSGTWKCFDGTPITNQATIYCQRYGDVYNNTIGITNTTGLQVQSPKPTGIGADMPREISLAYLADGKIVQIGVGRGVPEAVVFATSASQLTNTLNGVFYAYSNEWGDNYPTVQITNENGSYYFRALDDWAEYYKDYQTKYTKGSLVGNVSSTASTSYPTDGISGNYWYTYLGSDSIDPSACTIPSTINGGTAISITVTPGSGKVFSGTVSYTYQVSLNGGTWTTLATTTATSRSYTVPYGTTTVQARVVAKDNLGFSSSTYATSSQVSVINNQPPTAPGSIDVTNVIAGQQATITLTAATDPDGTIASYIYERSVDGSAWAQIANVNSLTQTDTISADWGTVAYRACAVDDDGASGPYVTSTTTVVNSGWVIISGPNNDLGSQPIPFNFDFYVSISGTTTSDQISVNVTLNGISIYNESVDADEPISLPIDTRTMATGTASIVVAASCASFIPASGEYTFSVPEITIADGGNLEQLENSTGQSVFPVTLARAVVGLQNYGVENKVHPGAYVGTGTYGNTNPTTLSALSFEPTLVIIQGTSGRTAILTKPSGIGSSIGPTDVSMLTVTWGIDSVSWYSGLTADDQMNTQSENYSYTVFGV